MSKKYSDASITDGVTANGTDRWPVLRSGGNVYITSAYLRTYMLANGIAPLASPALTGTPTAPTASPGTNTTQVATTAFVDAAVTGGGGGGGYTEGARVFHNSTQSLSAGTTLFSAFDSERWDTDTIHDTSTNNSRLTCQTAGKYIIGGSGRINNATAGANIDIRIRLNGGLLISINRQAAAGSTDFLETSTVFELAVNDYVELGFTSAAGSSMIVDHQAYYTPEFYMQRIG